MNGQLLADLARANVSPSRLAEKRGVTLEAIAHWIDASENRRALEALRALADAQADLVISRSRAEAARRLLRIAGDRETPETARKACVDLLQMTPGEGGADRASEGAGGRDAVREVLESLGALAPNAERRA